MTSLATDTDARTWAARISERWRATRGDVVAPTNAHFPSRFEAPVGKHSQKPDQQYEHAEFHFPNTPKIELNARRARQGWERWGLDAPVNPPRGESMGHGVVA